MYVRIIDHTTTKRGFGQQVRKDRVEKDGVRLVGYILVRKAGDESVTLTVYGKECVRGYKPEWLDKMNSVSPVYID